MVCIAIIWLLLLQPVWEEKPQELLQLSQPLQGTLVVYSKNIPPCMEREFRNVHKNPQSIFLPLRSR